jgi:hypothetical protein
LPAALLIDAMPLLLSIIFFLTLMAIFASHYAIASHLLITAIDSRHSCHFHITAFTLFLRRFSAIGVFRLSFFFRHIDVSSHFDFSPFRGCHCAAAFRTLFARSFTLK